MTFQLHVLEVIPGVFKIIAESTAKHAQHYDIKQYQEGFVCSVIMHAFSPSAVYCEHFLSKLIILTHWQNVRTKVINRRERVTENLGKTSTQK